MRDEEKTKGELISDLKKLRKKYTQLEQRLSAGTILQENPCTETILVVDDNQDTRITTIEMLKHYGYTLLEADSSQKAIKIIESHETTIHLVLSDVVMPQINGPEMIKEIVIIKPDIKVVFMSGYAEDQILHDEIFDILHSHIPFIKKPFTYEEIGQIIRQSLDQLT